MRRGWPGAGKARGKAREDPANRRRLAPEQTMDISVLGPMEAGAGGRPLSLGGGKPRALLAMLAPQAGSPVSTDHLIEGLWGESPPATATKMIQIFVSQVRKALDA